MNATFALSSLDGTNGFRLDGVAANDYSGIIVSSAGDIYGDGYDDLRVKFDIADTGITCDYPDDVTLTGIADGLEFEGSDLVTTPACEVGGCHP